MSAQKQTIALTGTQTLPDNAGNLQCDVMVVDFDTTLGAITYTLLTTAELYAAGAGINFITRGSVVAGAAAVTISGPINGGTSMIVQPGQSFEITITSTGYSGTIIFADGTSNADFGAFYNMATVAAIADSGLMPFDTTGVQHSSPGGTAFSLTTPTTIRVNKAGTYEIDWSATITEINQLVLTVNTVANADTLTGAATTHSQNSGRAIITLAAADVLSVKNVSGGAITPETTAGGAGANVLASLVIKRLA